MVLLVWHVLWTIILTSIRLIWQGLIWDYSSGYDRFFIKQPWIKSVFLWQPQTLWEWWWFICSGWKIKEVRIFIRNLCVCVCVCVCVWQGEGGKGGGRGSRGGGGGCMCVCVPLCSCMCVSVQVCAFVFMFVFLSLYVHVFFHLCVPVCWDTFILS